MWGGEVGWNVLGRGYFLDRVLNNYRGSVYLIQMHDWNVDPHMAVPVINQLKDSGIEAKGLFGQWDHDYPDGRTTTSIVRERAGTGGLPADGEVRPDAGSAGAVRLVPERGR